MDWIALIAAFGGGAFGAALGAVPVFILTGLMALVGVAAASQGHPELVQMAFGPVLGPHVSFGGAVAAAAYAASRKVGGGGRDIASPLMPLGRVDVLAMGGVFGCIGYLLNAGFGATGAAAWTDSVAATVVISNMAARLIFGKSGPFGTVGTTYGRRFRPDDSASWLPWQQEWKDVLMIGLAVGLFAAFICGHSGLGPGKETIGFALSTVSLVFLVTGSKIPVTHHISMTASLGVMHGGGVITGAIIGLIGALIGEVASRVFLIHGDTHIDPPAVAIAIVAMLLTVFGAMGVVLPAI